MPLFISEENFHPFVNSKWVNQLDGQVSELWGKLATGLSELKQTLVIYYLT